MRHTRVKDGSRIRCYICGKRHTIRIGLRSDGTQSKLGFIDCGDMIYIAAFWSSMEDNYFRIPYGPQR